MHGSAKTSHVRTKTEIHFIAQDYSVSVQRVCFHGGHFANPVMSRLREWRQLRVHACPGSAAIAS